MLCDERVGLQTCTETKLSGVVIGIMRSCPVGSIQIYFMRRDSRTGTEPILACVKAAASGWRSLSSAARRCDCGMSEACGSHRIPCYCFPTVTPQRMNPLAGVKPKLDAETGAKKFFGRPGLTHNACDLLRCSMAKLRSNIEFGGGDEASTYSHGEQYDDQLYPHLPLVPRRSGT